VAWIIRPGTLLLRKIGARMNLCAKRECFGKRKAYDRRQTWSGSQHLRLQTQEIIERPTQVPSHIKNKDKNLKNIQKIRHELALRKRGRWSRPPCMSVMALNREDISWVHNQYSSLKLTYHKMILRE
jgi:hypothetical protein